MIDTIRSKLPKILFVEDEPFLLGIYQAKLKLEGYDVVTAEDGAQALEILEKNIFDVIVLDIEMPKMDGFEVLQNIRRGTSHPASTVPVIMLSTLGQKSDIERGLKLGANECIVKASAMPGEVVEKIKQYIK